MIFRLRRTAVTGVAALAAVAALVAGPMPSASAATGCQYISSSPGVYTSTTLEYSNQWTIYTDGTGQAYYWYLKHNSGSIQDNGSANGDIRTGVEPANNYYMQIYNAGYSTRTWEVCYTVV